MSSKPVAVLLGVFAVSVPLVGWAVEAGVALTPSHVVSFLLLGLAGHTWLRDRPALPTGLVPLSALAFLLVAALSVVVVHLEPDIRVWGDSAHWKSTKQLIGLIFASALFFALYCLLRWYDLGLTVLQTHYWTTAVFGLLTLVQFGIAVADLTSPLANFPVRNSTLGELRRLSLMYGFPRVSLTLVEPSLLASYLLSGWAFWLYALDHPPFVSARARRLFVWSGVLLGVAVVLTGSRLAYGVCVVLVLGALAVRPRRLWRMGLVSASMLTGLMLTGTGHARMLVGTLVPKIQTVESTRPPDGRAAADRSPVTSALRNVETAIGGLDLSVQQRTASYIVAMSVLRERPVLGAGLGTSSLYMELKWPESLSPLPPTRVTSPTMMSHYATVATETGLLGVFCLTGFAVGIFRRLLKLSRAGDTNRALAFGAGASVAGYYLSAAAASLIIYQILLVWLLLAVALTARAPAAIDEEMEPAP